MRRVVQESLAAGDLRDQIDYLASNDTAVALRFIDAVEAAFQFLRDNPETGFLWGFETERLRDVRVKVVPGFPNHLIFFRTTDTSVRVLRVLYASRDVSREFQK